MRARLIAMMLCMALLASCAPLSAQEGSPPPAATPLPYAPYDDAMVVRTMQQVLYYRAMDGKQLRPQLTTLRLLSNETLAEALLRELLNGPSQSGYAPIFPAGSNILLLDVECSQDVATVNLTGSFSLLTSFERFAACAAMTNTLTELSAIRYVNFMVDGKAYPILRQPQVSVGETIPVGAMVRITEEIAYAYERIRTERELWATQGAPLTRQVTLYFSSADGTLLLPEVRRLDFMGDNFLPVLINAMARGPNDPSRMQRTLPAGTVVRAGWFEDEVAGRPDRGRIAHIDLTTAVGAYLDNPQVDKNLAYAAIVRTVTTLLPEVVGVRLYIAQEPVVPAANVETVQDLVMRRGDFPVQVGANATLYLPMYNGMLKPVLRTFAQSVAEEPRNWMAELIATIDQADLAQGYMPFPKVKDDAWLLGAALDGEILLVNLSQAAADGLSEVSQEAERAYIFAMVNTLCGIPGIKRIYFLVEGAPVETLAGGVYLTEPLLPNVGIVSREK